MFQIKVIMSVEDNIFDFIVRDRLKKECEDRDYKLSRDYLRNSMMLDMIAYCSFGREEEAILNLETTMKFIRGYKCVQWNLVPFGQTFIFNVTGSIIMFEFWRKCFIQIKVLVQRRESLPGESFHKVILREHGRFLDSDNFSTPDALEAEGSAVMDSLKSVSEAFYIEYNTT